VGSLIVVLVALLVISAATTLGPRLGFAAPLLLVVVGMWASLLPFVPDVDIEPGWTLAGEWLVRFSLCSSGGPEVCPVCSS
jgi:hypothetical protein